MVQIKLQRPAIKYSIRRQQYIDSQM